MKYDGHSFCCLSYHKEKHRRWHLCPEDSRRPDALEHVGKNTLRSHFKQNCITFSL